MWMCLGLADAKDVSTPSSIYNYFYHLSLMAVLFANDAG